MRTIGSTTSTSYRACSMTCGDGITTNSNEECDDGPANSDIRPDACRTNCTLPACGDGVADSNEACDDGPSNNDLIPDACRADCSAPSCGDDVIDTGEACDNGVNNGSGACSATCSLAGCGINGIDPGEICDDGNTADNDGCLGTCIPNTCGDTFRNDDRAPGAGVLFEEVCDGANCRADCGQDYSLCGNGAIEQGEGCEEGSANSDAPGATCRTDCQPARCGDGIVDPPAEQCDRQAGCATNCRWAR